MPSAATALVPMALTMALVMTSTKYYHSSAGCWSNEPQLLYLAVPLRNGIETTTLHT